MMIYKIVCMVHTQLKMMSAFMKVCVVTVVMQGLLHLRPEYAVLEQEVQRQLMFDDGIVGFELSIAEMYPLTLGLLAIGISSRGPLTAWGVGLCGSILVVVGDVLFVIGIDFSSIKLLFAGRIVFAIGEVFAQDVALIPLFMEHFHAADTSILYAAVLSGSCFARAGGFLVYRWLQDEYSYTFTETLFVFWFVLLFYPILYILLKAVLPEEKQQHPLPQQKGKASLVNTVINALKTQRKLPWYYWFMMTAAALFNASSLIYDDFILLPEIFTDMRTSKKVSKVVAWEQVLMGVICLLVTSLYYRGLLVDGNPRLTGMLLFLLLGLRFTAFVYISIRLLLLGRLVSKLWYEVSIEVLVHLGTFLFDMWAEPHLVALAGREDTSEACVMGLLSFFTALVALPLIHLQKELILWHKDSCIVLQVVSLSVVMLFMYLVWRNTPADALVTQFSHRPFDRQPAFPIGHKMPPRSATI